jgi:hypothetical protein
MAVFKIERGELVRVSETLEAMLRPDWADWEEYDDFIRVMGFIQYDDVVGVYRLYRREEFERPEGELPGVRYLFDVDIDGSNIDYILVGDDLPAYLRVLELLEPLVRRHERLQADIAARQR